MFWGFLTSADGSYHKYDFGQEGKVPMDDKHLRYFRPTSPPLSPLKKNYSCACIFQDRRRLASESFWQVLYLRDTTSAENLLLIDHTIQRNST